jgi:hypothetical protein
VTSIHELPRRGLLGNSPATPLPIQVARGARTAPDGRAVMGRVEVLGAATGVARPPPFDLPVAAPGVAARRRLPGS